MYIKKEKGKNLVSYAITHTVSLIIAESQKQGPPDKGFI